MHNVGQLNTWYRIGLHSCLNVAQLHLGINTGQLDTKYQVDVSTGLNMKPGINLCLNAAQLDTKYRVVLYLCLNAGNWILGIELPAFRHLNGVDASTSLISILG